MKSRMIILGALLWAPGTHLALADPGMAAADSAFAHAGCVLTVESSPESAIVFIDSVNIGNAPVTIDTLAPGIHSIRVQHRDLTNWLSGSAVDTVHLAPGEPRRVKYTLPQWYSIVTIPSGARVYAGDSLRGTTPFLLSPGADSAFTVRKEGFEDEHVTLASASRGIVARSLRKVWQAAPNGPDNPNSIDITGREQYRSSLPEYATGAAAILAGAASAYFKIRADNVNSQYLETGDPALLSRTKRLDSAAAVSLIVAEAGLVLFSIFLLSE